MLPLQIANEIAKKKKINAKYSLRSFAKEVKLSPTTLSFVLAGKRNLSLKSAKKIVSFLSISPDEKKSLLKVEQQRLSKKKLLSAQKSELKYYPIAQSETEIISDWRYFTVLELLRLQTDGLRFEDLAEKTNWPGFLLPEALKKLKAAGLVRNIQNCWFSNRESNFVPSHPISHQAIQNFHLGVLNEALNSVPNQSPDERDLSCTILAVPEACVTMVRKRIQEFRRDLDMEIEKLDLPKSKIYALSVQFFRLVN